MLVIGFGVHAFGEPQQGAVIGNYINPAPLANATPVSPDAFTTNDVVNGALGLAAGSDDHPGHPRVGRTGPERAVAPRQRVPVQVDHAATLPAHQRDRGGRALLRELRRGRSGGHEPEAAPALRSSCERHVPGTGRDGGVRSHQRAASWLRGSRLVVQPGPNTGVFHPTRAYDDMDVTWGGLRGQDDQCSTPFRRLIRPVLLEKGIPIGMLLVGAGRVPPERDAPVHVPDGNGSGAFGNTVANVAFARAAAGRQCRREETRSSSSRSTRRPIRLAASADGSHPDEGRSSAARDPHQGLRDLGPVEAVHPEPARSVAASCRSRARRPDTAASPPDRKSEEGAYQLLAGRARFFHSLLRYFRPEGHEWNRARHSSKTWRSAIP